VLEGRDVVDVVARDAQRADEPQGTAPAAGNWAAIGGVAAMLVCCLGHGLLVAFGAAGFAAAVGAAVGNPVVVIGAVAVFAAAGALIAVRLRSRWHANSARDRS
jgi:membrane protein implicated in regulation of membrane protease activity